MAEIDHIQYGRLLASVEHLTAQLRETSRELASLKNRLSEVEDRFKVGKGTLIGLILALGGSVWGLKEAFMAFFGRG